MQLHKISKQSLSYSNLRKKPHETVRSSGYYELSGCHEEERVPIAAYFSQKWGFS